ncbi:MAG: F0F1 ATP synthase subunit delta [Streptococcaceae bacterium]|jgi:F-type H+-transporting ATPase subunit delta|nr:F0F1 ATP synthase subunit delta [Streptococcaceae bacterium]
MALETYSKALLEVAQEKNQLDAVLDEVRQLSKVATDNQLKAFFNNPAISDSDKSSILDSLKTGASDLMANLLDTIRANGRLSDLTDILDEVNTEANKLFKISDVTVTSAVKLSDAQTSKLSNLTKQKFDLNEITLSNTVDESILGGFIINARGKIIDASIKTQLSKLAQSLN